MIIVERASAELGSINEIDEEVWEVIIREPDAEQALGAFINMANDDEYLAVGDWFRYRKE